MLLTKRNSIGLIAFFSLTASLSFFAYGQTRPAQPSAAANPAIRQPAGNPQSAAPQPGATRTGVPSTTAPGAAEQAPLPGTATPGLTAPGTPASPDVKAAEGAESIPLSDIPGVQEGLDSLKKGDRKAAAVKFAEAYKTRSDLTPAGIAVAIELFNEQKFDQVRFWLEQTVEDCPTDPEAYIILAEIAQSERRLLEARMLATEGLVIASEYKTNAKRQRNLALRGQLVLVLVAEQREDWADAQQRLERMIQGSPDESEYYTRLAVVLFQQNNIEKSIAMFQQATAKGAQIPTPYAMIAQLYDQKDNEADAKKYLAAAIKQGQDNFQVMSVAAYLALKWNIIPQAKQYAEQALKLKPESPEAKSMCGLIALYEKDYAKAEQYYSDILAKNPLDFGATIGNCLAQCEQGNAPKTKFALETAEKAASNNPQSVDALSTWAWAAFKSGQVDIAERILQQVHTSGAMNASGAYYLAEIKMAKGAKSEAEILVNAALSTKNNYPKKSAAIELQQKIKQ